jgi:O-antigen/teichoic acid export membrane protein
VLDHRYHAAVHIVPLVIMGYLFHALFCILYLPIMQAKRTRFIFLISLIAFSVNMVCNFAFIPRWGMYGAAWATAIAYAAEAAGAYLFAQSFLSLPYRRRALLACLAIAGVLLWFTLSPCATAWHGLLALPAGLSALLFLAVIGGQDLKMTVAAIWSARNRRTVATSVLL